VNKYGFKIRTRNGMLVENLQVQAPDREAAENRIRQIYHHCEIIECGEIAPSVKGENIDLENMIALIGKEEPRRD
jgi:hypothetical protein